MDNDIKVGDRVQLINDNNQMLKNKFRCQNGDYANVLSIDDENSNDIYVDIKLEETSNSNNVIATGLKLSRFKKVGE